MPRYQAYIKFKEMADTYGPIFKMNIFGATHVIISTAKIADDLLIRKGAFYSDRGHLHMISLLTNDGDLLASSSRGEYWRRGRRFAAAMLTPAKASQWEPYQTREARVMVMDMVRNPKEYAFWFDRYATSVSLRETYGKRMGSPDDERLHTHKIVERMHNLERLATPGGYLVELIPALLYLPESLAPFRREAKALHKIESHYFKELVDEACEKFEGGVPESPPSFIRSWLTKEDHWELSRAEVTYVLGTLYGGGSGTTANAMQSFVLAMCHYPEWQIKLQKEVDEVVGPDRLPTFEDVQRLPVVRAVVKETLRWRPVVPGNIPHRLTEDDVYMGYYIPKGALVHGNTWAIHREDALYPNGETFNPDRWLDSEFTTYKEPLEQHPNIQRYSVFGYGRRICVGLETAARSLFIQVASLGWACQISKKLDSSGKEIPVPWYDYTEGSNVSPNPFVFDLKPRSQKRMDLLRSSLSSALSEEV